MDNVMFSSRKISLEVEKSSYKRQFGIRPWKKLDSSSLYFREMVRPVFSRDSQYNMQSISRALGLPLWVDSIARSISYFSYRILIYRRYNWIQEGVGAWLSNRSKTDTVAYRFWICSACANSECLMESRYCTESSHPVYYSRMAVWWMLYLKSKNWGIYKWLTASISLSIWN